MSWENSSQGRLGQLLTLQLNMSLISLFSWLCVGVNPAMLNVAIQWCLQDDWGIEHHMPLDYIMSFAHPNEELAVVQCCSQALGVCKLFYLNHPRANKWWCSACKLAAIGHEGAERGRLPELVERTREGESKRVCYMERAPCEKLRWVGLKPWEKYPNHILSLCTTSWALCSVCYLWSQPEAYGQGSPLV